jgi:pyruvate ferredoxin oxidoreductase alpha subunit
MSKRIFCNGNEAAALALLHARVEVAALYPITPSTAAAEILAGYVRDGLLHAKIIPVEGENAAMTACIGASVVGVRTATITSSQGLLYMLQQVFAAVGMRVPTIIMDATRAVSAPLNVHGDHGDVMAIRASGSIQLFARNAQEVYDLTLIAFVLGETMRLPVMVCYDGFSVSHTASRVTVCTEEEARGFVGKYRPKDSLLNFDEPRTFGTACGPDYYTEARYAVRVALRGALAVFHDVCARYALLSGRTYAAVETYQTDGADTIVVLLGSTAGTMRGIVDRLRENGQKVGMLTLSCYRPFPDEAVRAALRGATRVIVLDRSDDLGTPFGPLCSDVQSALYALRGQRPEITNFIYGLGGRELLPDEAMRIFGESEDCTSRESGSVSYLQVRE